MATRAPRRAVVGLALFISSLPILSVGAVENSTAFDYNATSWGNVNSSNASAAVTEPTPTQPGLPPTTQPGLPPTTQPGLPPTTEPDLPPTTQPGLPPTTEPGLPSDPLPESEILPIPSTDVAKLCPCDEQMQKCDMNCCCDTDCVVELPLFTGCSIPFVRTSKLLCTQDVANYTLVKKIYPVLLVTLQTETISDLFCIYASNYANAVSFPLPTVPTYGNFAQLFQKFTGFMFESQNSDLTPPTENQNSPGYQFGDVMWTGDKSGQTGIFPLPAAAFTPHCLDENPAAFLKNQHNRCSRHISVEQDCSSEAALNLQTYVDIKLLSENNANTALVPVKLTSVVLQSIEGARAEVEVVDLLDLKPVLLPTSVCAHAVLEVSYLISYSPAGAVTDASVSAVLGSLVGAGVPVGLQQDFHIKFVQDGEEAAVRHSGNPGYVVGLPLLSGTKTTDGITRSTDPTDTLSVLGASADPDCLQGPHLRSPVLFGLDSVSGCSLRLEDVVNCSLVSQQLLDVLRGPNHPQYVAQFGNSPLGYQLDWVPIKSSFSFTGNQRCRIPLSLHLEIQWTKYGSLVNPQAQIVSVKEVIQTNTSSLPLLSGGGSSLTVSNSVAFVPVSAAALPGYRARPTIDAKLPYDFFFPFA